MPEEPKRPLQVFPSTGSRHRLCHAHIIPLWDADRDPLPQGDDIPQGDNVRGLYARLTKDGVDAWFDKAKLHGERSRTILPGQDWELEIRKAVREIIDV